MGFTFLTIINLIGVVGVSVSMYMNLKQAKKNAKEQLRLNILYKKMKLFVYANRPELEIFEVDEENWIVRLDNLLKARMNNRGFFDS